ncbi:hypothetical protein [Paenibacillus sp. sgz500958]|uniref:hypothetical protein n=1 Tax=Paenibacillus sp. sgz500958 TaxID=3242475 RepID=UPI0036D277B3
MATIFTTTGSILNGSETGVRAQFVRLLIINENLTNAASFDLRVFSIADNSVNTPKTPLAHQVFAVAANSATNITVPISAFPIYEVQLGITTATAAIDVTVTTVGVDVIGKIVDSQQYLNTELTQIPALTPVP